MASPTRNLFASLPPPAECLALLIGTVELTIFGVGGLVNPPQFASGFGIPFLTGPPSTSPLDGSGSETEREVKMRDTQTALVQALAARNMQNGILLLTLGLWVRDRKLLGAAVGLGVITTLTDYLVVKWYGVKEAVGGHAIGVANCLLIGGSLMWWGRDDPWF